MSKVIENFDLKDSQQQSEVFPTASTETTSEVSEKKPSSDLYTNISKRIVEQIRSCIVYGKLASCDIDDRVSEELRSFPDDINLIDSLFNEINNSDFAGAGNKSNLLCNLISQWKLKSKTVREHAILGRIYMLRQSVRMAFGLSSSSSSTSSSKGKHRQTKAKKRPCLVWNINEKETTVLLLATFADQDPRQNDVLPELSREYLMKYLLSIHPTAPTPGRRSVQLMVSSCMKQSLGEQLSSYLILKPISVSNETLWPEPQAEHISIDDLLYINELVGELMKQEHAERLKTVQYDIVDKVLPTGNDSDDESTNSSIPISRAITTYLFKKYDSTKSSRIQEWINECNENVFFDVDEQINLNQDRRTSFDNVTRISSCDLDIIDGEETNV